MPAEPNFSFDFPPVTFPVGTKAQGYWANYEAMEADGVVSATVEPVFCTRVIDWHGEQTIYFSLQLFFKPEGWNAEKYGLIYTDEAFEEAVQKWSKDIGLEDVFGRVSFSEQGMQGEDYVDMEYRAHDDVKPHWHAYWPSHDAAVAWFQKTVMTSTSVRL